MDDQQPRPEPLCLPTPPKVSPPASRHSYLDTVLSTPRVQESRSRHVAGSTMPSVSALIPDSQAAMMSLENPTRETLVAPAKPEQARAGKKDTLVQQNHLRNGDHRPGQDLLSGAFCIDCNNCGKSIPGEHYHCGICDDGDFDLCATCIATDVTCDGDGHWLIKRRIQNGLLVSSVTETIAPKKWQEETSLEHGKENVNTNPCAPRTCNSCITGEDERSHHFISRADGKAEFPGEELVTCTNCPDYDLCMMCFSLGDHGHHPAHRFQPVSAYAPNIRSRILSLCEAGRGLAHAALCDGCDKVS
jgi:next to BRCA1 gene 1 protein